MITLGAGFSQTTLVVMAVVTTVAVAVPIGLGIYYMDHQGKSALCEIGCALRSRMLSLY